jgi:hypothetical protein
MRLPVPKTAPNILDVPVESKFVPLLKQAKKFAVCPIGLC